MQAVYARFQQNNSFKTSNSQNNVSRWLSAVCLCDRFWTAFCCGASTWLMIIVHWTLKLDHQCQLVQSFIERGLKHIDLQKQESIKCVKDRSLHCKKTNQCFKALTLVMLTNNIGVNIFFYSIEEERWILRHKSKYANLLLKKIKCSNIDEFLVHAEEQKHLW